MCVIQIILSLSRLLIFLHYNYLLHCENKISVCNLENRNNLSQSFYARTTIEVNWLNFSKLVGSLLLISQVTMICINQATKATCTCNNLGNLSNNYTFVRHFLKMLSVYDVFISFYCISTSSMIIFMIWIIYIQLPPFPWS